MKMEKSNLASISSNAKSNDSSEPMKQEFSDDENIIVSTKTKKDCVLSCEQENNLRRGHDVPTSTTTSISNDPERKIIAENFQYDQVVEDVSLKPAKGVRVDNAILLMKRTNLYLSEAGKECQSSSVDEEVNTAIQLKKWTKLYLGDSNSSDDSSND